MTDLLQPSAVLPPASGRFWGLVPCAGTGSRAVPAGAAAALPKQYQPVAGRPLVMHTLTAFAGVVRLAGTLVAVAPGDRFLDAYPHATYFTVECGGPTRAETVLGGLRALLARGALATDWVLVHDAARCLIQPDWVERLIDACEDDEVGGLLALPLADTLKAAVTGSQGEPRAQGTVDRAGKWAAQTPQMFRLGLLRPALRAALADPQTAAAITDEASAIEMLGHQPRLVPGAYDNFKVTWPGDFALAERLLATRP